MKTLHDYKVLCTLEQAIRAHKIGAPLNPCNEATFMQDGMQKAFLSRKLVVRINNKNYYIPTTQQLLGWIRDKKSLDVFVLPKSGNYVFNICSVNSETPIGDSLKREFVLKDEAELEATNSVLSCLEENIINN